MRAIRLASPRAYRSRAFRFLSIAAVNGSACGSMAGAVLFLVGTTFVLALTRINSQVKKAIAATTDTIAPAVVIPALKTTKTITEYQTTIPTSRATRWRRQSARSIKAWRRIAHTATIHHTGVVHMITVTRMCSIFSPSHCHPSLILPCPWGGV